MTKLINEMPFSLIIQNIARYIVVGGMLNYLQSFIGICLQLQFYLVKGILLPRVPLEGKLESQPYGEQQA